MKSMSNYSPGAAIVAKSAGQITKNVAVGHRHRPDNPAAFVAASAERQVA